MHMTRCEGGNESVVLLSLFFTKHFHDSLTLCETTCEWQPESQVITISPFRFIYCDVW